MCVINTKGNAKNTHKLQILERDNNKEYKHTKSCVALRLWNRLVGCVKTQKNKHPETNDKKCLKTQKIAKSQRIV